MKLIDAIRNVKRLETNSYWSNAVPEEALCMELDISYFYFPDDLTMRIHAYPIYQWICTDTYVGLYALWIDDEPVGSIYRGTRKGDYEFKWISEEAVNKLREIILSYNETILNLEFINDSDDIGETGMVHYVSQLLTDDVLYKDRPVKILIKYDTYGGNNTTPLKYRREGHSYFINAPEESQRGNSVLIRDGENEIVVPVTEIQIPFLVDPVAKVL